jgi:hypothetical protein
MKMSCSFVNDDLFIDYGYLLNFPEKTSGFPALLGLVIIKITRRPCSKKMLAIKYLFACNNLLILIY